MSSFSWAENICDDADKYGFICVDHEVTVDGGLVIYEATPGVGWHNDGPVPIGPTTLEEIRALLEERHDYYKARLEEVEQVLREAEQATQFHNETEGAEAEALSKDIEAILRDCRMDVDVENPSERRYELMAYPPGSGPQDDWIGVTVDGTDLDVWYAIYVGKQQVYKRTDNLLDFDPEAVIPDLVQKFQEWLANPESIPEDPDVESA